MSIWLLAVFVFLGPIWASITTYTVFYAGSRATKDAELQHAKHIADAFGIESLNNNSNTGDDTND